MARDPDAIQRDIEKAREALASSLDELETKANPTRAVEAGKAGLQEKLEDPRVRYALIGVGTLAAVLVLRKLLR
ncbi:DUF3618 domain-containing protein [Actinopolyspora halophila]|uniref:DUF3618 domain-containing protein n=1 Tax=Actinopolyspora halophila TaxID=1850 RepID=UPI000372E87A|nr:DUF3618 domain-containing protein [Actinopolyspora halophila]